MICHLSRILTSAIPVVLGFMAMSACENGPTDVPGTGPETAIEREMVLSISPNLQELLAIDATGTSDVTDELNDYLAGLPDGSTVTFPAGALYRAEGIVQLIDKTNLTIEGNGALIFARTDGSGAPPPDGFAKGWPRARSHVDILRGSGIVIRNLRVKGANPNAGSDDGAYVAAFEGQHGFDVRGVSDLVLDQVTVTDTYGDLIYISGRGGVWSDSISVTNSHLERSGRQGVTLIGARNVQILDSYIGEISRSVIDIEPATDNAGAENVLIQRNTFGPCRHLLLTAGGGGPNVNDISFVENRLIGIGLKVRVYAQDGARRSNFRIINNVSETTLGLPVAALRFGRVDGIDVRGNYQTMNPNRSMTAVTSCLSTGVIVRRNEFPGAAKHYDTIPDCTGMEK